MKTKVTLFKITIAIVLLMNVTFVTAQFRFGEAESFAASLYVDPGASIKESGLDIGIDIEYNGPIFVRAGFESFAELPGGYFDTVLWVLALQLEKKSELQCTWAVV